MHCQPYSFYRFSAFVGKCQSHAMIFRCSWFAVISFMLYSETTVCLQGTCEPSIDCTISERRLSAPRCAPLIPPSNASTKKTAASDSISDIETMCQAATHMTKMLVNVRWFQIYGNPSTNWYIIKSSFAQISSGWKECSQNPLGKAFSRGELSAIGEICVKEFSHHTLWRSLR